MFYAGGNLMPNYDLPKAAPEPLRRVQLLINSIDTEHGSEWLPDWLAERGLEAGELERARALREALRALVLANNGLRLDQASVRVLNGAARALGVEVSEVADVVVVTDGDAIDEVVAVALNAMVDGTWSRLKACRNCRWCFYDESPNRSARWCSMQLCGNRKKTRAYRARRRARA